MAKVVAFNGSPRKDGNTSILIGHMFEELENDGIETELVQVGKEEGPAVHRLHEVFREQRRALRF